MFNDYPILSIFDNLCSNIYNIDVGQTKHNMEGI